MLSKIDTITVPAMAFTGIAVAAGMFAATLTATPADARVATWDTISDWHIQGDSQAGICSASMDYTNGHTVSFVVDKSGFSLAISGVQATPNTPYSLITVASNGNYGTLSATSDETGSILFFPNMSPDSIYTLATSHSFAVRGLDEYDLTGSYAAIGSMMECVKVLNSLGV